MVNLFLEGHFSVFAVCSFGRGFFIIVVMNLLQMGPPE
jgi:hypothetical protein